MSPIRIKPLKGNTAFNAVFAQKRRFRSEGLVLVVEFVSHTEETDGSTPQRKEHNIKAGIVVRKKVARSAVLRNRIKRLLRESLRQCAQEHPEWLGNVRAIVALWNTTPDHPRSIHLHDVLPRVEESLKRVHSFASRLSS